MARILVTGATSGLGKLTVASLKSQGHEVVAHARRSGEGQVFGDLSFIDEVRNLADQANKIGRFDAVIHNAGTMDDSAVVEVNVVAPYVLSALMQVPQRAILLSSSMHAGGSTAHMADAIADRARASYSDAKMWETILAMALAKRWPSSGVFAVDPGWVPTRMGGAGAPDDLEKGHLTQEWLATTDPQQESGTYWHHMRTQKPHRDVLDRRNQELLIAALEKRTGLVLPSN
ncbi:SDR family NAD(P)-dependent oxidoreductase [Corynebacterium sp. S7]